MAVDGRIETKPKVSGPSPANAHSPRVTRTTATEAGTGKPEQRPPETLRTAYNFSINLKLLTNKNFTEEQTKSGSPTLEPLASF